jgi:hypothetical protein
MSAAAGTPKTEWYRPRDGYGYEPVNWKDWITMGFATEIRRGSIDWHSWPWEFDPKATIEYAGTLNFS